MPYGTFVSLHAFWAMLCPGHSKDRFAIGAVLGTRKKQAFFQPKQYASKTMNEAQTHLTTTEYELLARGKDAKARLHAVDLILQEFGIDVRDKKGAEGKLLNCDIFQGMENLTKISSFCKLPAGEIRDIDVVFWARSFRHSQRALPRGTLWGTMVPITQQINFDSGFIGPTIYKDALDFVTRL
ncbi:hypothetical protein Tco_1321417 [Tanacetum coccineum]